jgi:hypothetical protein
VSALLASHFLPPTRLVRRAPLLALLVAATLALAGCGGDDGDVQVESPGAATPSTPAGTPPGGVGAPARATPAAGATPVAIDPGAPFDARAGSPFGDDDVVLAMAAAGIAATRQHEAVGCAAGDGMTGYLYSALIGGEPLAFDLWVYPTPRLLAEAGWSIEGNGRARGCSAFGSADYPAYVVGNVALSTSSPPSASRERLIAAFLGLGAGASAPPAPSGATFPFAAADLQTALAGGGLAYSPNGDSVACRDARAVGLGYGSSEAPTLLLWVYASSDELREDWVVERGERPRYHLDDAGACVESGWVYWNENTLLVLDDPAWATADEERAAVIAAFLSLVRPAANP